MKPRILLSHLAAFGIGGSLFFLIPRDGARDSSAEAETSRASSRRAAAGETSGFSSSETGGARARGPRTSGGRAGIDASDPAAAMAEIIRIGDPLDRQAALLDLVSRLAPGDFAAFAEQYRNSDHFADSGGEYEIILRAWAKADPFAALDDATKRGSRGDASTILAAWAGADPAAAEQWARANHEGDGPNGYLSAVIRGIAAHDVNLAASLAADLPRSRERGAAMDAITRALFLQGNEAAMDFPASIQDPQVRDGFVWMISERLARKDAQTAADWLASFPNGETQRRGARTVAAALAQENVGQAAEWVGKLQPGAQAEAARGVIVPMSNDDIQGTARWVASLNGVPGYDAVVEEFVWSCDVRDPEQSAAWIQAIADEAQQTRLYHRMLGGWSNRDDAAARAWVANNNANLPNSVRNRFRQR